MLTPAPTGFSHSGNHRSEIGILRGRDDEFNRYVVLAPIRHYRHITGEGLPSDQLFLCPELALWPPGYTDCDW